MGSLDNAAQLLNDDLLRRYCTAAQVYVAATVVTENVSTPSHAERVVLANRVLNNPQHQIDRLIALVACHAPLASKEATVGDGQAITEDDIVTRISQIWTAVALLEEN